MIIGMIVGLIIGIIADYRDYYGITPLKSEMDAEKNTILEAGATFKNPSFLVSMLNFGGGGASIN